MTTRSDFPATAEALRADPLFNEWWYYGVELLPGVAIPGQHPTSIPMLPRLLMRRCDLRGMACLDIGTMEGLTPTLMARGGASRVLAIDGLDYCKQKLAAVRHYYGVPFEYRTGGPMHSLPESLPDEGCHFLNCAALPSHVSSPF